jgi:hypothetical protein
MPPALSRWASVNGDRQAETATIPIRADVDLLYGDAGNDWLTQVPTGQDDGEPGGTFVFFLLAGAGH